MSYSLFFARRLSLSSGKRNYSPAIRVSITAVALSIAVMLASVAIVIGFKREIRDKVVGFNSHISLYAVPEYEEDSNVISLGPTLKEILSKEPYVDDYSLEASIPAVIKTPDDFKGIYLRSLNGKTTGDFINENLEEGSIPDFTKTSGDDKIVLSRLAANQLNLKTGDKIDVYFFANDIKVQRLTVAGIYNSHFDSYDQVIAYGSLAMIQKIAGIKPTEGTNIQIHTDNFDAIGDNTLNLSETLKNAIETGLLYKNYRIDNAIHQGEGYFTWLSLLDTNVFVILTLMTLVSIATLVSGMLILILDKKRFIGIARAMGASVKEIRHIFVYLALRVALYGMVIGNVLMLTVLWCQYKWHFIPLDADAYYIDYVPVEINWWYVIILNIACFVIIYLSLILPSRFVAKISPADAMRSSEQ